MKRKRKYSLSRDSMGEYSNNTLPRESMIVHKRAKLGGVVISSSGELAGLERALLVSILASSFLAMQKPRGREREREERNAKR